jgi:hypothetical protein
VLRLKCESFREKYVTLGFSAQPGTLHMFPCAYKRSAWKRTPEQIRHVAINSVVHAVGSNMAAIDGVVPSIQWRQDPSNGDWAPHWSLRVRTPWQAMNYALYLLIVKGAPMAFCLNCGSAFTSERRSRKYCPPPKNCKDEYNNRRR